MSNTPSNSSSIQVPIRIHPQQPGTLRSDTGIQTVSNTLPNPVIHSQHENNQAHQSVIPSVASQVSTQTVQHRNNQLTPVFNITQHPPTFNSRLNTFDGVPIPPVLRPYQPPESKDHSNEKAAKPTKIIRRIYGCRQNNRQSPNAENEYLCSFSDSPNIQYCKWILQSEIDTDIYSLQKVKEFNESNLQSEFIKITSPTNNIQNNPISPVQIICQINEKYLFRFYMSNIGIFCWDDESHGEFYKNLIQDFQNRKKVQRKAPIITDGVKLILDSIQKQMGLIFCGDKNDIIEFLSVFTGKVALITKDSNFSWWCEHFEEKNLSYVGYRGDEFSRAMIRQFQITNRTVLLLLTYSSIISDFSYFHDFDFDCLIADDGERLKNAHGMKRNALLSINCKYRIVLTSKLKVDQLQSIQNFVQNDEIIYFNEQKYIPKYIFVRPTDFQLALLASKPFEADKICQNGLLVNPKNNNYEFDQSLNIYEKYSAKFLLLGKIAKNIQVKTVFIFKSHKLLELCKKYLDSIEISFKSPENKEVEALIALFFFDDADIEKYEIKIAIDCYYNKPNYYRLILYGSREHYFFAKKQQNRNIRKVPIVHIPSPPLILFDYCTESPKFEDIIKKSASIVSADVFDFQSLGISEFVDKKQIKNAIHELCQNGFQFCNRPLYLSIAMALFRALTPENVTLYPLSFFKLAKETKITEVSAFLCDSKKNWLKPIKAMYQMVDFTPIHELKKYFHRSADRILKNIENKIITMNFFRTNDTFLKFDMLPPSHLSTPEIDKNLVISMKQGVFSMCDQKRIENIINVMKAELFANDFQERYKFHFWSKREVTSLANEFANFGGILPYQKITLLSKTNEAIQNLKAELSRQLINGQSTIKIGSIVSPAQKVPALSIPQVITISEPLAGQLELRLQLGKALRAALDLDLNVNGGEVDSIVGKDLFLSSFVRSFGSQNANLNAEAWLQLLKGIVEFGVSYLPELILSPHLPFRQFLTPNDIAFLDGKFAILTETFSDEKSGIPSCLKSETSLLNSIQIAVKEAKAAAPPETSPEQQFPQVQIGKQRPLQTMPIGVQPPVPPKLNTQPQQQQQQQQQQPQPVPQMQPQGGRNYSPPNELLQRAADLQNQMRHEKKKMKQMKPMMPAIPQKKQIHQQMPMQQGHYMPQHQLPLPIPQPQPQIQIQDQQQPLQPPQRQAMMIMKAVDNKTSNEENQKQQQQQQWQRQPYYMPSVEIGRKVPENSPAHQQPQQQQQQQQQQQIQQMLQQQQMPPQDAIALPLKKRPITVMGSPSVHPPQPIQQQQPESMPAISPVIQAQTSSIVEPLKATHVRMSQAAARQMMNEDFLKTLPHSTRQPHAGSSNGAVVVQQQQQQPQSPQQQQSPSFPPAPQLFKQQPVPITQGSEIQTSGSLLPPKKKHLASSPTK